MKKLSCIKYIFLFFVVISACLGSYAQDRNIADGEANHFRELSEQTKEYKKTDSLHGVYNSNRKSGTEMHALKFSVTKGYANDDMQYLYGAIISKESTEITEYYLKYDKGKRKIVAKSKLPLE